MTDQNDTGIKSSVETIGELIGTRLFQPAAIQRDFSWETENCRALFEDIYRVFSAINPQFDYQDADVGSPDQMGTHAEGDAEVALSGVAPEIDIPIEAPPETYLLGPMYLSPPTNGVTQIFDGLQRMTSLTLLLSVMRDRLDETHADWANWLHAFVEDQNWGYRLTYPSTSHKETVTARWLLEFAQKRGETRRNRQQVEASTPRGRVARAIKVFRQLTHDMPAEEIIAFASFLMSKVQVVAIELNEPRLARQAFVTSNQRGVALQPVDIFKGILMDIAGNDERSRLVKQRWDVISQTPDLNGFMKAVDFIERREQQGPTHLMDFGDYLAEVRGGFAILEWMERLELLSQSWRNMKTALADPRRDPFNGNLWRLGLLHWTEWQPLALHLVYAYENARRLEQANRINTVVRRFELFHRRAMAITLAGGGDKMRASVIKRAIEQSEGMVSDKRKYDCMSLSRGAMALKPHQKDRARRNLQIGLEERAARSSLIKWVESLTWPAENLPDYIRTGTVEHILPQTPAADAVQWLADFPDADERLELCDSLGNLILIDADSNRQAASRDFSEKLNVYRQMKQAYVMARDVAQREAWRPQDIRERDQHMRGFIEQQLQWESDAPDQA